MAKTPVTPYFLSLASSTTLTSALDLQHSYREVLLCVPSMASSTLICVRASTLGSTYYPVYDNLSKDLMVIPVEPNLAQAIKLPVTAFRYLKLELSVQVQQALNFEFLCAE